MSLKSARIKNSRSVKENVYDTASSKLNPKTTRKPLSDKTNSASDDNISLSSPKYITKTRKKVDPTPNINIGEDLKMQTRRKRKVPERFNDNELLIKLNKSVELKENEENVTTKKSNATVFVTHLKTDKPLETNLADCRPKRICRLPSRFDDHSISPTKNVPVQPIQASTPITQCKGSKTIPTKVIKQDKQMDDTELTTTLKNKADTNNNAKVSLSKSLCKETPSKDGNKKINKPTRLIHQDYSFKMFDDKKKAAKRDASNLDVYEFTYDPTQEPPPQKKKRKRTIRKKQEKQQPAFTNNYNKNVTKSLIALKNVLSAKKMQGKTQQETVVKQKKCTDIVKQSGLNEKNKIRGKTGKTEQHMANYEQNVTQKNYNSYRVEDIIVNNESEIISAEKEMNYSPVNSPYNIRLASESRDHFEGIQKDDEPLNLQAISFFDENPAASSSMNTSARDPKATPWRVEFGQLPIKWQANTYVKPNMTPAFESSFLVLGDKKKHVYTNIINEDNEQLPDIFESESTPKLRQTSIISFIKEVAEKSAKKKSKSTPIKNNTVFDDNSNISHNLDITPVKQMTSRSPKKSLTPRKIKSSENVTSRNGNISISDKENSGEKAKEKNKDITYFGFDESEEIDQENILPKKYVDKSQRKALRPRSRLILQELNQKEPKVHLSTTANVDKRVKRNIIDNLEVVKTQNLPEKINHSNYEKTNVINHDVITDTNNMTQEDSQSVHLFEDLEVVHHVKPPRKSYVKQKRVAFRKNSVSSDSRDSDVAEQDESCVEEDDLHDLTFQVESMQPKKTKTKKKSKKLLSKKEVKEVEAWAAGFNSMCEDVDEFALVIE